MKFPAERSPLQVGFTDALRSSAGVLLPTYLLMAVLLTVSAEFAGIPFLLSAPLTLSFGVIAVAAVEALRRYVLATRPSGRGRVATRTFRGVIWALLGTSIPITAFAFAGAVTRCFGQACGNTDHFMMIALSVWSLIALALLPMGYRLLTGAAWLRPRSG